MSSKFINPRDPENVEITKRIKSWVEEKCALEEADVISVNQVECNDPGCLGAETHILIFYGNGAPKKHVKICKPLIYVRERDIDQCLL